MNEKWNQYFFGEPTEEEKRELFQELEKNEDRNREFAEAEYRRAVRIITQRR